VNWLQEFLTIEVMLAFFGGILVGSGLLWLYLKRKGNLMSLKRFPYQAIVTVVVVAVMVYIMVATNQARECAIRLNVSVSTEQDIAKIERDALATAIVRSQGVPVEIQALPQNDPARKAYMDPITAQYLASMKSASDKRTANQSVREAAQKACGQ
jgi:hypothetical protein